MLYQIEIVLPSRESLAAVENAVNRELKSLSIPPISLIKLGNNRYLIRSKRAMSANLDEIRSVVKRAWFFVTN